MRIERAGRHRLVHDMLEHHLVLIALKRGAACQQLVGHDGKGILVGRRDRGAAPLLGSHIGRGATNSPGRTRTELGDSEIGQEQIGAIQVVLIAADQEIGRFDIAMDNMMIVRILKGVSGLPHKLCNISRRKQALVFTLPQPVRK